MTPQPAQWHGYERCDFELGGRACILVRPETAAPGLPWIWRTEFFGHEPQADLALLEAGLHLAYIDVQDMYGAPVALDHMDALYAHVRAVFGLAAKVVLEGFSRGGLFAYNWAARHPERTAGIYADAPAVDLGSWPGGAGRRGRSAGDWEKCLLVYGLQEAELLDGRHSPVDNLDRLAAAEVPLLHVCGDMDEAALFDENTAVLERRYRAAGGSITVLKKPFGRHHPHSLRNPAPIVAFVLRCVGLPHGPCPTPGTPFGYDYFVSRAGLWRSLARLRRQGSGRIAFLGGSITAGPGWREAVMVDLQGRLPGLSLDFVNAGIPSLGSVPGAFRFRQDVLARGPVDLLFVEAAVNDETNGAGTPDQIRGMEGIVRQARLADPGMDVVLLHFADPAKLAVIRRGEVPPVIANHERVADRYGCPSLDLATEVAERIAAGELAWHRDFRDLHPSALGHALYARSIARLLDACWGDPAPAGPLPPHRLPDAVDQASYANGQLINPGAAGAAPGWTLHLAWRPTDGAATRPGFAGVPVLAGEVPGAALHLPFTGTAVGIFVAAGPDAGQIVFSVDGAPPHTVDLFTNWSTGLHLPWAQVLAAGLAPGRHDLRLEIAPTGHPDSRGHAVRIVHFLVNADD